MMNLNGYVSSIDVLPYIIKFVASVKKNLNRCFIVSKWNEITTQNERSLMVLFN